MNKIYRAFLSIIFVSACGGGGGGAGAQLEDVEHASITVLSPFATIWIVLFIFALIIRQRY